MDGFGDVLGGDVFGGGEVGDGAGDFEDAIMRAGAELELFHGHSEHGFALDAEGAKFAELLGAHAGIGAHFPRAKARGLELAGADDSFADGGAGLAGGLAAHFVKGHGGGLDVEIYAAP